jgi:deazaflavin-dependent oxidoreductase (nitroreductase family)
MDDRWSELEAEAYCYLTTVGRRTTRPHTIEIWFVLRRPTLYMLSGGGSGSDWVRNLIETPGVSVRIGRELFSGTARLVTEPGEDQIARELLFAKYRASYEGDLSTWRDRALPIAVHLTLA